MDNETSASTIEQYLSGAVEYDALTDAERCAICAAMEGEWIRPDRIGSDWHHTCFDGSYPQESALRLVERFHIHLLPSPTWVTDTEANIEWSADAPMCQTRHDNGEWVYINEPTPSAAIVHAVCALARVQWPYKAEHAEVTG